MPDKGRKEIEIPPVGRIAQAPIRAEPDERLLVARAEPDERLFGGTVKGSYPFDIEVVDIRDGKPKNEEPQVVAGTFTKWQSTATWLTIWLDTGYGVHIRLNGLQPIIDELVSREVLSRLKGKNEA